MTKDQRGTNGRNHKGGIWALLGSLAWGIWENADSVAGLHISGTDIHLLYVRGTASSLSQEVERLGQVNFRGFSGMFWREGNTPNSISSQVFYKKLAILGNSDAQIGTLFRKVNAFPHSVHRLIGMDEGNIQMWDF